ncbi:MAG TPA: MarR family transcriptional regulator [Chloroflexota bacterium]|nr:MarR family transcriptional regulator [Chloroflexota bacterium]
MPPGHRARLTLTFRVYTLNTMAADVDLSACRACYCLAARKTARAITRLYDERLRPHGLRATQFSILVALALKGPTSVGELAELLGLEHTTLTRSAARLERDGWVATASAPDHRRRPLSLTQAGRRKVEEAFPAWKEVQDSISRVGPDAWREALRRRGGSIIDGKRSDS